MKANLVFVKLYCLLYKWRMENSFKRREKT